VRPLREFPSKITRGCGTGFALTILMKKMLVLSIIVSLVILWAVSCGGGGSTSGGSQTPTGPSTTNPAPQPQASVSTTVNIVSSSGSGAFNPNPVQVASGGTIMWRNTTTVPHVLVMNDGTAIGTVAPGASITSTLSGDGGGFRCVTHPSMVGSINGSSAPQPPPDDGY
jgi:plastocyanin